MLALLGLLTAQPSAGSFLCEMHLAVLHGYSQALLQPGKPVFHGAVQGSGLVKLKSCVLQFAAFAAPATSTAWAGQCSPQWLAREDLFLYSPHKTGEVGALQKEQTKNGCHCKHILFCSLKIVALGA